MAHVRIRRRNRSRTHWGYRCPDSGCSGHRRLYRSAAADALALPGFTFGIDVVLLVGSLRLGTPEEITCQEVGRRFDEWLGQLAEALQAEGASPQQQRCLRHLFQVLTGLRPWLTCCYDVGGLPRTNNEMELTIRAIKTRNRRISGRNNWNAYLLRYGRCVAYYEWWQQQPQGNQQLEAHLLRVPAKRWRQVRQQTRLCHHYQLNRFRFRHHPQQYLAHLEERWTQALRM